jgi:HAD superfamily hydrolase (TIGR01549 family)
MERMPPAARRRAEAILHRHEASAAATSDLQPGADEVVAALRRHRWPIALMTRNSRDSVRQFLERHRLTFDVVRTREDGRIKPDPGPVHDICEALGGRGEDAWVVGDFHFDILCGRAAGSRTVLYLEPLLPRPEWADEADYCISHLPDLLGILGLGTTA